MGLGRRTNFSYLFEPASNQLTSWLVHILKHLWCSDKPRATLDSQDSPRSGFGGSHHLPPYSILCVSPRHLHSNGFLSQDSQGGVPKLSRFRLTKLCEFITVCSDLWLRWGLEQTCSSLWELSNDVLHSTCTFGEKKMFEKKKNCSFSRIECFEYAKTFFICVKFWTYKLCN